MDRPALLLLSVVAAACSSEAVAQAPRLTAEERFFEQEIRPLLAERCFECHGPDADRVKGGLRMSGRRALLTGGDAGPAVVPGDPDASLLVRAVRYEESSLEMPPSGPLPEDEVRLLARWVLGGAHWPGSDEESVEDAPEEHGFDLVGARTRWAYHALERPEVPAVRRADLVTNPVDAFVLARLEEAGVEPSPPATPHELVRRAYFDLIGFPPPREVVEEFRSRDPARAWPGLIDRLLDMPQYGERWGRHWLDVVRFAETSGYERDEPKRFAWRYRDYVIEAFNDNKPFDRFVLEQLAGDELEGRTPESLVATGFYRLGPWDSEPDGIQQGVFDQYDDMVRTISEGFMGMTIGCARCHDHKFDPIRQRDYYGMVAFLRNVRPFADTAPTLDAPVFTPLDPPDVVRRWEREAGPEFADLNENLRKLLNRVKMRMLVERLALQPKDLREAIELRPDQRLASQKLLILDSLDAIPDEVAEANVHPAEQASLTWLREQIDGFPSLDWALTVREFGPRLKETRVLVRGDADLPGEPVPPTFPPVLCPDDDASVPEITSVRRRFDASTGARLTLAEWLVDPRHPLTARVFVNRVWQHHFGRGIVETPNDFGSTGAAPTHPRLLDWLASEFVRSGWDVKELHRLIMGSTAYRMSSRTSPAPPGDPDNRLFWRQNPRRLEAEALRDSVLAVSGRLDPTRGGPGFHPRLPPEVLAGASRPGEGWGVSDEAARSRRSVYAYVKRNMMDPLMQAFDYSNANLPVGVRSSTNVPTQALMLLNGEFAHRSADAFADRVAAEAGDDPSSRVERAFELALSRAPTPREREIALGLLEQHADALSEPRASTLTFLPRVPSILEIKYLNAATGEDLLLGPRAEWTYTRGLWGNSYNNTRSLEEDRGPAALLRSEAAADVRIEAELRMQEGADHASLLLRAEPAADVFLGVEVLLDPRDETLRLRLHGDAPTTLATEPAGVRAGRWHRVVVQASGPRVRVWLDDREQPVVDVTDAALERRGRVGVRVWGGAVDVRRFVAQLDGRRVEPEFPEPRPPRWSALQSLCLALLNLNEFLYVD